MAFFVFSFFLLYGKGGSEYSCVLLILPVPLVFLDLDNENMKA